MLNVVVHYMDHMLKLILRKSGDREKNITELLRGCKNFVNANNKVYEG